MAENRLSSARLCVIGMGNILFHDEGVGVYAARCLQAAYRFAPEIEIVDGAALGFGLMDFFEGDRRLLVLDALQTDAPAGTIYRLPEEQLLNLGPSMRPTAHEVEPIELLKLSTLLGQAPRMVLLGIVPADMTQLEVGLSPALQAAFPRFLDAALSELGASGARAHPVRTVSLDDVVGSLVTRTS